MKIHDIKDILKAYKLKITPIRVKILDLFMGSHEPLSAEDIMKAIIKDRINDVTVYRTLASFESMGILRQIDLRRGSVFYELTSKHHHHIVCTSCKAIEDFDFCLIDDLSDKIAKSSKKFNHITDHSFELFGLCKKCAPKK